MRKSTRSALIAVLATASLSATPAFAGWGDYDGGSRDGGSRGRAASYINPDTGAATANPDVNANSSCFNPDQTDNQTLSTPTANRNVHNDACFLDYDRDGAGAKLDGPATFQATGVGFISACPDPDKTATTDGPKFAVLSDTNGDGLKDRCFQSGYQEKGVAGDKEFHARLNNTTTPGTQNVVWCSDSDQNGCGDEWNKSSISINWTAV